MRSKTFWLLALGSVLSLVLFAASSCRSEAAREHEHEHGKVQALTLPELEAADLSDTPLKVVATISIIGDVVAQVGGDAIELTTLMGPGQDPHSYEPTPQDMATVSQAHVIFVNGWDLEEALIHDLEDIAENVPVVPVSADIEPLAFDQAGSPTAGLPANEHGTVDPHVWFSIHNVEQWVENVQHVLSDLDRANAETYERNARTYLSELAELEVYVKAQLAGIPAEKRLLVTNHDSFSYLARDYDLEILGTVIPGASTLAEPSASDLAELIEKMDEHGACTIFTETTVSDKLAQTVAAELDGCDQIRVLKLYTGSVGPAGSGAAGYIGMFRHNVETIVRGLR